jgi:hypothetical protein
MQAAFHVRSTFLCMSRSTTAGLVSHGALQLRVAPTAASASSPRQHQAEAVLIPMFGDSRRIVPCPEVTVADVEHTLTCLSTELCVRRAHLQRVDGVAIRKIASVETIAWEIYVLREWCIGCRWYLEDSSSYREISRSFPMTAVAQLKLRHSHWLVSVQLRATCVHTCRSSYTSCLTQTPFRTSTYVSVG